MNTVWTIYHKYVKVMGSAKIAWKRSSTFDRLLNKMTFGRLLAKMSFHRLINKMSFGRFLNKMSFDKFYKMTYD